MYPCVCGLDVHKKFVMACVRRIGEQGRVDREIRRFETMTRNLHARREWLRREGVTHVAMESTGVFWKPVMNLLEGHFEQVMVVNAQHVKNVPGRKTDIRDAEWIAQLLQCGLLRPSFVPARAQRQRRDLTRHRATLAEERTAVANRIHKVLEDTNIKLGAVATDILGVSGRKMLDRLLAGEESPAALAEEARGRLRGKIPQLRVALEGQVTDHHRFELKLLLAQYDFLGTQIDELTQRIAATASPPFDQAVQLLVTAPGVQTRGAQAVLAEIGTDMKPLPTADNIVSWAKVCPGNNRTGGKDKHGKSGKGNRWLRAALGQIALAAVHTKGTYLQAKYRRLARKGKSRALVAIQHDLLRAFYHMLKHQVPYADLGADFFDRRNLDHLRQHHLRRLESLGFKVTLEVAA
jgi:transposase